MIASRRAVLYLVLVFLLGLALGGLGMVWAGRHGWSYAGAERQRAPRGVAWLCRELGLSAEQRQQVETILDEMGSAYREIRQRTRPEYEAVRQQGRDRIRAVLTEQQRARFEEWVREMDEREVRRRQGHEKQRQEQPSGRGQE
jgi:Spy/CpxP family protein refolding chaperone